MTMPTISKKTWAMLIIGVLALIAVWYFFLRKKKGSESSYSKNLLIPGDENGYTKTKGGKKCTGPCPSDPSLTCWIPCPEVNTKHVAGSNKDCVEIVGSNPRRWDCGGSIFHDSKGQVV